MIDPADFLGWLRERLIVVTQLGVEGNYDLTPGEWEKRFREYFEERKMQ